MSAQSGATREQLQDELTEALGQVEGMRGYATTLRKENETLWRLFHEISEALHAPDERLPVPLEEFMARFEKVDGETHRAPSPEPGDNNVALSLIDHHRLPRAV